MCRLKNVHRAYAYRLFNNSILSALSKKNSRESCISTLQLYASVFYPQDLQDTLEVCGRIPYKIVWDYFSKLKQSQSTEMTIMRFHVWQEDEEAAFFSLFDYFYTRQRIGVVGKNRPHVKDFYLIALPSSDKVPHHILPFNGPGTLSLG